MKLICLSAAASLAWLTCSGVELYVSPNGSDTNPGSAAHPFATLARARDEIRQLKANAALPKEGATVELLGGTYRLNTTVEFAGQDSGWANGPIVYRAFQRQAVKLVGGVTIPLSKFKAVSDPAVVRRLDPAARSHVVCISTRELGLTHAGPFPQVFSDSGGLFELFWQGQRMPLARWPNRGYVTMKRVLVNGDSKTGGTFEYREDRPARWLENPNIWLKGKWRVAGKTRPFG